MPRRSQTSAPPVLPASPFLTRVTLRQYRVQPAVYPFNIPLLAGGLELGFSTLATFLVGEIGSGKSTCLEALAWAAGSVAQSGNREHAYAEGADGHALGRALSLTWGQKVAGGSTGAVLGYGDPAAHIEGSAESDVPIALGSLVDRRPTAAPDPHPS